MPHTFYQVDAFTDTLFKGNPAAVMRLDDFLPDDLMQTIAFENNLSETAYVVPAGHHFKLRWFTPTVEIDFCGHATIATAHVLAAEYGLTPPFTFETKIGQLSVDIIDGRYVLDAPVSKAAATVITEAMRGAFPVAIEAAFTPAEGIDEDPVTGSAHAAIGPYWAARLGKRKLMAYQASKRGGTLWLDIGEERLTISGHAVTYMKAEIARL